MIAEFIISFDFELGWGSIENGLWKTREKKGVYKRLRSIFPTLLSELDALQIPVTWAFVGAMLESPGKIKLDHLPIGIRELSNDFLASAENATTDARDLFEQIFDTNIKHNLSSHTYSHVRFNYAGIDSAFIYTEMQLFNDVCKKQGVRTTSLVFPQNIEGYHKELRNLGYLSVRTSPDGKIYANRMVYLIASALSPPPLSSINKMSCGLHRHSGSMFYNTGKNRIHRLPFVYKRALRGIDYAIKNKQIIHIWIHPFNLAESPLLLASLLKVLKYVSKQIDKGMIQVGAF